MGKKTYWLTAPGCGPELANLDADQVAYYKEAGYGVVRDDYCRYLDGNGRAVRGQELPIRGKRRGHHD